MQQGAGAQGYCRGGALARRGALGAGSGSGAPGAWRAGAYCSALRRRGERITEAPDDSQGGGREKRRGQRPAGRLQTRAGSERAPDWQQQPRIRGLSLRGKRSARGSVIVQWILLELDSHIGDHASSASKRGFTQEAAHT